MISGCKKSIQISCTLCQTIREKSVKSAKLFHSQRDNSKKFRCMEQNSGKLNSNNNLSKGQPISQTVFKKCGKTIEMCEDFKNVWKYVKNLAHVYEESELFEVKCPRWTIMPRQIRLKWLNSRKSHVTFIIKIKD